LDKVVLALFCRFPPEGLSANRKLAIIMATTGEPASLVAILFGGSVARQRAADLITFIALSCVEQTSGLTES
jgi:hypothetical protein